MLKSNSKELNALSLSLDFAKRLEDSDPDFKIHSLYQRVINLIDQKGEIFSILLKSLDNGPHSMRIDTDLGFKERQIKKTDQVIINSQKIMIADKLIINLKDYQLFDSQLTGKIKLQEENLKKNLKLAAQMMAKKGKKGGAKYFYQKNFSRAQDNFENEFSAQKASTIEKEFAKRAEKYILNTDKNPEKLVGFGMGLTPTGDDFLTGYFLTTAVLDDEYAAAIFKNLKSILKKLEISTTDISREMILRALELKMRENIKNLIISFNQDKQKMSLYLEEVLKIGSSSGTDILAGIMTAYQEILAKKMEDKNVF